MEWDEQITLGLEPRGGATLTEVDGKVYMCCGADRSGEAFNDTHELDLGERHKR